MSAEALYNAWREPPSLAWAQIVNPARPTPRGEPDQTDIFVARWQRVADLVNQERRPVGAEI